MIRLLVWENAWGPMAFKHPGHVALAITDGDKIDSYISWWPDDSDPTFKQHVTGNRVGNKHTIGTDYSSELGANSRARLLAGATPRPGQTNAELIQENGFYVKNPTKAWAKRPDHVVELPAFDDRAPREMTTLGLCESNVQDWWRLYSEKKLGYNQYRYKMVSKTNNCAAVVMAALVAGGCDLYLKHDKVFMYYSPTDILNYVNRLRIKINELNTKAQLINATMLSNHRKMTPETRSKFGSLNPDGALDIWTVDEWRRASAVTVGRRKEQIAHIDEMITQYWGLGSDWTDTNATMKTLQLAGILQEVQSHIIEKPNSDRREAVLKLGSQCIMVLRERAAHCESWSWTIEASLGFTF
jgi:hypothetical protein